MSNKKYTVFLESKIEFIPYMEDDELIYDKCGTLQKCKEWVLIELEKMYQKNKEYILNATEKNLKP